VADRGDLARRLIWLMFGRTLVISVVLGLSVWLLVAAETSTSGVAWLLSSVIAATYVLTIVCAVLLRRGVAAERLVWPQLFGDLVLTAILVYATGAALSAYTFFFPLSVVAAGALTYRRGVVVIGVASLVLMAGTALLAWRDALPLPMVPQVQPWAQSATELGGKIALNAAAIVAVGILAFVFGDQLQRTTQSLATERQTVADLVTLHQDIVRSLTSGLITIDLDGRVLTGNQAAMDILGKAIVGGEPIDDVIPGLGARIAELSPQSPLRRADLAIRREPVPTLWLGVSVSPLRDVTDRVVGRVINFQDLTELRRMEQSMRRAERLASVGELAAGITHEIRNPLASISGSVELLRQAPQVTDDDRALMAIVTREIERLNALITDLLDYTNPRPRQVSTVDLGVLVDETLRVFRQDPTLGKTTVNAEIEDATIIVDGDPEKLRQVLWNLLRNAAEAGGASITVAIARDGTSASMRIRDDGPGIPADVAQKIFDPFFSTKKRGSGLGLATCHAIVIEHGGTIEVESQPGATTFSIQLPLKTR
jgi:two-component system sensor histidine kinase PilS (NtrC family)